MIEKEINYTIRFTEHQFKELYQILNQQKGSGHLSTDHDLILIYNELKKHFNS